MEFDFQWLLIGLPLAFAFGWVASRLDLRQLGRARRETPSAYFKGLNFLLNEQQDKAIDAFVEAVQHDPDTAELHFALGNLFRRRGEFERAVRVHEHLLARGDLKAHDRERAQHALAQDFMKAGLFDRAEAAWRALDGTSFDHEARLAQLALAERSRDWPRAIEVASRLDQRQAGAFATRIAHYECELAQAADAAGRTAEAEAALARARNAAPGAARPLLLSGQRQAKAGRAAEAMAAWDELREQPGQPGSGAFLLVAEDYARAALACGRGEVAKSALQALLEHHAAIELVAALDVLDAGGAGGADGAGSTAGTKAAPDTAATPATAPARERWVMQLQRAPSLSAVQQVLAGSPATLSPAGLETLRGAVARAARPLQRYRCAACGFEAQHYFWQCPGCLGWDTYPPQRIDALQ